MQSISIHLAANTKCSLRYISTRNCFSHLSSTVKSLFLFPLFSCFSLLQRASPESLLWQYSCRSQSSPHSHFLLKLCHNAWEANRGIKTALLFRMTSHLTYAPVYTQFIHSHGIVIPHEYFSAGTGFPALTIETVTISSFYRLYLTPS
jgi:hypothetical protein